MFYVYELVDPRDDSVFYVGKGKGSRRFQHERDAIKGMAGEKCDRIRGILASGKGLIARIVGYFSNEADAYRAEAERIAFFGLDNLTNISPGGGGGVAVPVDPVKEARDCVRKGRETIRRALDYKARGYSIMWRGADFVDLGYIMAKSLRERAGAEYFDKHVWGD